MQLFTDIISDKELDSIIQVASYEEHHFDMLARLAGLDPAQDFQHSNLRMVDFRGADLRGFNFTGSDLRFSTKDGRTIIDETTVFDDAEIEWIEEDEVQVVQIMLEAQAATSFDSRRRALNRLSESANTTAHVNKFLVKSIEATNNLDAAIDFADFIVGDLSATHLKTINEKIASLLDKKARSSVSRSNRRGSEIIAAEQIFRRLENASGPVLKNAFFVLADIVDVKCQDLALRHYTTTLGDMAAAFRRA